MVLRSVRTTRSEITSGSLSRSAGCDTLRNGILSLVGVMKLAGQNFAAAKAEGPTDSTLKLLFRGCC
jgi:hypothetical protein